MGRYDVGIQAYGERAVIVTWPDVVDVEVLKDIQALQRALIKHVSFANSEQIPAYNSLTVLMEDNRHIDTLILQISEIYAALDDDRQAVDVQRWHIPVCYDPSLGIDLIEVAGKLGLSNEEVMKLHTSEVYTVYAIGFQPGFLYLGGLQGALHIPRKPVPRLKVKQGDVGLAGKQTGIYPQVSPGGWNIIGNTPVTLFDVSSIPPCPVKVGDEVCFYSIRIEEYFRIASMADRSLASHGRHKSIPI